MRAAVLLFAAGAIAGYIPAGEHTVYSTEEVTITSCGPEVTNCPGSTAKPTQPSTTCTEETSTPSAYPVHSSSSAVVYPHPYSSPSETPAGPTYSHPSAPSYSSVASPTYSSPAAPVYTSPSGGAPGYGSSPSGGSGSSPSGGAPGYGSSPSESSSPSGGAPGYGSSPSGGAPGYSSPAGSPAPGPTQPGGPISYSSPAAPVYTSPAAPYPISGSGGFTTYCPTASTGYHAPTSSYGPTFTGAANSLNVGAGLGAFAAVAAMLI